jgi:hypothetical protein
LSYNGHCNPEIDGLIDQQSAEANQEKRRQLVWEIERELAEHGARPIIFTIDAAAADILMSRADDHGQQHLQRLVLGRRLAGQIASGPATG